MSEPRISEEILRQIEEHTRSVTDREVGGVLVGTVGDGSVADTEIVAAIPALKAVAASANVTFTHDVWEEALGIVDRDHPGQKIVGWYHSHPNFGVFLSDYDLFIHQNFFPLPGMMALVVDPIRGDLGWFTTVGDEVQRVGGRSIDPMPQHIGGSQPSAAARRSFGTVVIGVAAVLVAFVVGWAVAPRGGDGADPVALDAARDRATTAEQRAATAEAEAARSLERIRALEQDAEATDADGNTPMADDRASDGDDRGEAPDPGSGVSVQLDRVQTVYVVRSGDSLWRIAERFYGDGDRYPEIVSANDLDIAAASIDPGDELIIPRSDGGPGEFSVRSTDG